MLTNSLQSQTLCILDRQIYPANVRSGRPRQCQGPREGGGGASRARAFPRFDLRQVNGVDARGFGQLLLRHVAVIAVHPDGTFFRQQTICHGERKRFSTFGLGPILHFFVQPRLGIHSCQQPQSAHL